MVFGVLGIARAMVTATVTEFKAAYAILVGQEITVIKVCSSNSIR